MNERAKVLLYTVVASGVLWIAIERFMGSTEEYASRLDIRSTPRNPDWDPETDVVNDHTPLNPSSVVRAEVDPHASVEGEVVSASAEDENEEEPPEHDAEEERLTVADAERADSDGDMAEAVIVVPGMSPEEAELLARLDPDLLHGRPATRALDLTLADCAVVGTGVDEADVATTTRPDTTVAVRFRHASVAIKGASLNRIDALVDAFRRCESALLVAEHNPQGRVDVADERFVARRADELKYYLLQRRVPRELMRFPERS